MHVAAQQSRVDTVVQILIGAKANNDSMTLVSSYYVTKRESRKVV